MYDITPELLAKARQRVLDSRRLGFTPEEIDAHLRSEIGMGLEEVTSPKVRDYLRAAGMGLTAGFEDELAGVRAWFHGSSFADAAKKYTTARDEVRGNHEMAKAMAPKRMLAAELTGAVAPALATLPFGGGGAGPAVGAGVRALRAGALAGGQGLVAGAGYSDKTDVPGVAKDAAVSGGISALLGSGGSLLGSMLRGAGSHAADALNPARPVIHEGAVQLPPNAAESIASQEALAPGTAVLADRSPEMSAMTRVVGADPAAGLTAHLEARTRYDALKQARANVAKSYEALDAANPEIPVDDRLRDILRQVGEHVPGDKVPLERLRSIRTSYIEDLRSSTKAATLKTAGRLVSDLGSWLTEQVPELKPLDTNYALLTGRLDAAKKLLREVASSSKNYSASRVAGVDAGSVGGSLPSGSHGLAAAVAEALRPDRGGRARAVKQLMLTPGDATQTALKAMLEARAHINAGPSALSQLLRAGLLGDLAPQAGVHGRSLLF